MWRQQTLQSAMFLATLFCQKIVWSTFSSDKYSTMSRTHSHRAQEGLWVSALDSGYENMAWLHPLPRLLSLYLSYQRYQIIKNGINHVMKFIKY